MRGSVKGQAKSILARLNGVGSSKRDMRAESEIKSLSGNKEVSDKIHSHLYYKAVENTAKQLLDYAKTEFSIKDATKISNEVVSSFIEHKIDIGLTQKSLQNTIGHLAKVEISLSSYLDERGQKESNLFDRDTLSNLKDIVKDSAAENIATNRAYDNPNLVISNLDHDKTTLVAVLQCEYGLRVAEASHIRENQLSNDNILTVQGKGGYLLDKQLSQEVADQIREHSENGVFNVDANLYYSDLKQACEQSNEAYNGSHGFRYNFAQNTYHEHFAECRENGSTYEEAKEEARLYTSEQLGHHRGDITDRYLQ